MVKYYHCEKCKRVYDTETWIGEVHSYNGDVLHVMKESNKKIKYSKKM